MRMCYPESAFTKSEQFSGDWLLLLMVFKPLDLTWLQTVSQGKKMVKMLRRFGQLGRDLGKSMVVSKMAAIT